METSPLELSVATCLVALPSSHCEITDENLLPLKSAIRDETRAPVRPAGGADRQRLCCDAAEREGAAARRVGRGEGGGAPALVRCEKGGGLCLLASVQEMGRDRRVLRDSCAEVSAGERAMRMRALPWPERHDWSNQVSVESRKGMYFCFFEIAANTPPSVESDLLIAWQPPVTQSTSQPWNMLSTGWALELLLYKRRWAGVEALRSWLAVSAVPH